MGLDEWWRGSGGGRRAFCSWSRPEAVAAQASVSSHSPTRDLASPSPFWSSSPLTLPDGHVVGIAAGGNHSLAVTRSGRVYQFGGRVFLQPSPLDTAYIRSGGEGGEGGGGGSGSGKEREVPLRAVSVAAGEGASALVDASGHLYTWGKNLSTGMLGHRGYGLGTNLPVRVEALVGAHVGHVSLGSKHAAAVVGAPPHKAAPLR